VHIEARNPRHRFGTRLFASRTSGTSESYRERRGRRARRAAEPTRRCDRGNLVATHRDRDNKHQGFLQENLR